MARKLSDVEKAATEILRRKGITDMPKWRKTILAERKLAIMQDEDTNWVNRTLEEEYLKVVTRSITKEGGN